MEFESDDTMERAEPRAMIARERAGLMELLNEKDEQGELRHPNFMELYEHFEPKKSDLVRVFTESELKELCLRVKCYVQMELCNPVEDAAVRLRSEGRLQKKTRKDANKLLTKAVMRHKAVALYTQKEIDSHRQYFWPIRLRYNIMNLNVWKHEREELMRQNSALTLNESNDEHLVETNSLNASELSNNITIGNGGVGSETLNVGTPDLDRELNGNTEHHTDSEAIIIETCLVDTDELNAKEVLKHENLHFPDYNGIIEEDNENEQEKMISDSEFGYISLSDSIEMGEVGSTQDNNSDLVKAAREVNTESMSVDEDLYSQSQGKAASEQIQYETFNTQIPLTSTQSQKQDNNL